jgi:hypothetical protein
MKISKIFIGVAITAAIFASCENQDVSYSDYKYQTVYFANQYPVRTLELGRDLYVDNALDTTRRVAIDATMGGVYTNKKNRIITVKVDTSLISGIYFTDTGNKVLAMPTNYYKLSSDNQIIIHSGKILGGDTVHLTDAFFADTMALTKHYVIPMLMTSVQGADSILQGTANVSNPNRCVSSDWSVVPKDYVLYCIDYANPWQAYYLRRGTDVITTASGTKTTSVRHATYVENNDVVSTSTNSLTSCTLPLSIKDSSGKTVSYNLILSFASTSPYYCSCTVSGSSSAYSISGTGTFMKNGDKNSIGGSDRDALYLNYSVNFKNLNLTYATIDTLTVRNRGIAPTYFTVTKK